ncbi:hypothetical protein FHX08_003675 [Rhizobium sp. BK529]|uniref:hypothetical protein n=1 Tax=Rhizobium sp. BK529 TaxID=2586983 RepID=UPI00161C674F|nr:hypothetical protein [Rhizobium sp. BK529]MBB3593272.1 hypothetical protein [Rhizobium sp. BK529]
MVDPAAIDTVEYLHRGDITARRSELTEGIRVHFQEEGRPSVGRACLSCPGTLLTRKALVLVPLHVLLASRRKITLTSSMMKINFIISALTPFLVDGLRFLSQLEENKLRVGNILA